MNTKSIVWNNENLDIDALLKCQTVDFAYAKGDTIKIKLLLWEQKPMSNECDKVSIQTIDTISPVMDISKDDIEKYLTGYITNYLQQVSAVKNASLDNALLNSEQKSNDEKAIICQSFAKSLRGFVRYIEHLEYNPYTITGKDLIEFMQKKGDYKFNISGRTKTELFSFLEQNKTDIKEYPVSLDYIMENLTAFAKDKIQKYLTEKELSLSKEDYNILTAKYTEIIKDNLETKLSSELAKIYNTALTSQIKDEIDKKNVMTEKDIEINNQLDVNTLFKHSMTSPLQISFDNHSRLCEAWLYEKESIEGNKFTVLEVNTYAVTPYNSANHIPLENGEKDAISDYIKEYMNSYKQILKEIKNCETVEDSEALWRTYTEKINNISEKEVYAVDMAKKVMPLLKDYIGKAIYEYMMDNHISVPYFNNSEDHIKMINDLHDRTNTIINKQNGIEELER